MSESLLGSQAYCTIVRSLIPSALPKVTVYPGVGFSYVNVFLAFVPLSPSFYGSLNPNQGLSETPVRIVIGWPNQFKAFHRPLTGGDLSFSSHAWCLNDVLAIDSFGFVLFISYFL